MSSNKLFIGGLNYNTTEEYLNEELEKYGEVLSLRIVTEHETGQSRGFAFVTYRTIEEATKAVTALENVVFDGRRVGVKYAIDRR